MKPTIIIVIKFKKLLKHHQISTYNFECISIIDCCIWIKVKFFCPIFSYFREQNGNNLRTAFFHQRIMLIIVIILILRITTIIKNNYQTTNKQLLLILPNHHQITTFNFDLHHICCTLLKVKHIRRTSEYNGKFLIISLK